MATFHAVTGLNDATGVYHSAGEDFTVPVDGSNVPLAADDRANLATGRMYLVTGGGGTTVQSYTPVVVSSPGGELFKNTDTATPLPVGSGAPLTAWAPSTSYKPGQLVTYQGSVYVAKAAFTSTSSFVSSNWDLLPVAATPDALKISAFTLATGKLHPVDTTSGAVTGNIPDTTDALDAIVKLVAGANTLTIAAPSGQTFNTGSGSATFTGLSSSGKLNRSARFVRAAGSSVIYIEPAVPLNEFDSTVTDVVRAGRRTALRPLNRIAPPNVKFRGMNLGPAVTSGYGGGWAQMFLDWPWTAYIKKQIDLSKAAGANAIRLIGGMGAIKQGQSIATYVARYEQFVSYCRDQDLYVYAVGCAFGHINGATNSELVGYLQALIAMLNRYENVIGIDLSQEPFGEGYARKGVTYGSLTQPQRDAVDAEIEADCAALYTAAKAATKIPVSFSSSTSFADTRTTRMFPYCDFLDFHLYGALDSLSIANASEIGTIQGTATAMGKPWIIGEWGQAATTVTATTASGSPNLTSVSALTSELANGMLINGPGIPAGTSIVSGAGSGTIVMSANATASATVTVDVTPNRTRRAERVRSLVERPEFDGAFNWAAKWPVGPTSALGFFDDADAERSDVAPTFRTMPTEDRPWVYKTKAGGNVVLDYSSVGFVVSVDTGTIYLNRPCRVRARINMDMDPSVTGQVYQAYLANLTTTAPNSAVLTGVDKRHNLVWEGVGFAAAGSHSYQGVVTRPVGTNNTGNLRGCELTLEFTPI